MQWKITENLTLAVKWKQTEKRNFCRMTTIKYSNDDRRHSLILYCVLCVICSDDVEDVKGGRKAMWLVTFNTECRRTTMWASFLFIFLWWCVRWRRRRALESEWIFNLFILISDVERKNENDLAWRWKWKWSFSFHSFTFDFTWRHLFCFWNVWQKKKKNLFWIKNEISYFSSLKDHHTQFILNLELDFFILTKKKTFHNNDQVSSQKKKIFIDFFVNRFSH
jgi:hypothetical protein